MKGIIFDIKKFAVNDGPGIRTTVFVKGCPMKCLWCHNPESQKLQPEVFPQTVTDEFYEHPQTIFGREVSTDEVMLEIKKDVIFYDESGGGVTFSGGEPLLQIEFLHELLRKCSLEQINTAVDTSGFADRSSFERIYDLVNIFLFDLKIADEREHIKLTGVSNKLIHNNLTYLSNRGEKVNIRIPLIPGITDTEKNLSQIAELISGLNNINKIDLLPYNKIGKGKYKRLNVDYYFKNAETQNPNTLNNISSIFLKLGYNVSIRG